LTRLDQLAELFTADNMGITTRRVILM
jgi:hypothetical protein